MNEAKCSVNWKMYAPSGIQMQFTIREDDPDLHLPLLDAYLEALHLRGYTATEPGLDAGEKREEVNAYVIGETKKGDACVYLYSSKTALQWRIATVYVERFGELPFKPAGKKWEASAAPERGEAERKGFLQTVAPFSIAMEAQEPDAEGKVHWRFSRVLPGNGPAPAAPAITSKLVQPSESDAEFDAIPSASEERASNGKPPDESFAERKLAVNHAPMQYGKLAEGFANEFPAYKNKHGVFDDGHIRASLMERGFAEITPENVKAAFAKLAEHALSKMADAEAAKRR